MQHYPHHPDERDIEHFRHGAGDRIFFSEGSAELGGRARQVLAAQGQIYVLVNNAGITRDRVPVVEPLAEIRRWSGLPPGMALFDHVLAFETPAQQEAGAPTGHPLQVQLLPGRELRLTLHGSEAEVAAPQAERLLARHPDEPEAAQAKTYLDDVQRCEALQEFTTP